jgi:hypothetical protein
VFGRGAACLSESNPATRRTSLKNHSSAPPVGCSIRHWRGGARPIDRLPDQHRQAFQVGTAGEATYPRQADGARDQGLSAVVQGRDGAHWTARDRMPGGHRRPRRSWGANFACVRSEGLWQSSLLASRVMTTFHPSSVLRAPDAESRRGGHPHVDRRLEEGGAARNMGRSPASESHAERRQQHHAPVIGADTAKALGLTIPRSGIIHP